MCDCVCLCMCATFHCMCESVCACVAHVYDFESCFCMLFEN